VQCSFFEQFFGEMRDGETEIAGVVGRFCGFSLPEFWRNANMPENFSENLARKVQSERTQKTAERYALLRTIAERENEREVVRRDMEIQGLKAEEYAKEVGRMKRELEILIDRLVKKNRFIRSIRDKLEQAMKLANGESRRAVHAVIELLEARASDEEERSAVILQMQAVILQMQAVCGDFIRRLQTARPEINDNEAKICALLLMKLSSPKIALTLGMSDRTVEKYRSNIRKKLG